MGHTISKQQNQQMSDGQQMTSSSIEQHIDPSTTPKDLHVKIGKNKQNAAKAKKLKKTQTQHRHNVKTIDKVVPTKSGASTSVYQERSTGSVVITIRLLKMESARSFEDANIEGDLHSKFNRSTVDSTQLKCETNNLLASDVLHKNTRNAHENNIQNQNNSYKMDNNNSCVNLNNQSDLSANHRLKEYLNTVLTSNLVNCDNGNNDKLGFNERHSIKNEPTLRSEVSICDKVQTNCTSQTEHQPASNGMVNSLSQALNTFNMTDKQQSGDLSSSHNAELAKITKLRTLPDSPSAVISSNLISSVSPYPHHFPIANIIRSDCLKAMVDEHSSQCQQAKTDGSCCGKSKGTNKESKEFKAKIQNWGTKFNCTKLRGNKSLSSSLSSEPSSPSPSSSSSQLTPNVDADNGMGKPIITAISAQKSTALLLEKSALFSTNGGNVIVVRMDQKQPWFAPDEYSTEDCDKKVRLQRAIEIAESVETPPGFISTSNLQSLHSLSSSNLPLLSNPMPGTVNDSNGNLSTTFPQYQVVHCSNSPQPLNFWTQLLQHPEEIHRIHSQVDFIHYLVPDLKQITNCSFYWGKMDRYEAERLLENKPEGTFLLRDSAQDDFLFSVSFRKYNRSLHARIEQLHHEFSFDCHDPDVYTSKTVTGLLEHYKDPSCVMFFEPALTLPLNRNFVFSLQQLCRATIVSNTTYDGINDLCLPIKLKSYLKEYHYKQCLRTKQFDTS